MAVKPITLAYLKSTKNLVIGNPSAKVSLAQDEAFVRSVVDCLNSPVQSYNEAQGSTDDVRIEAAHVLSSLSYGSEAALFSLLRTNTVQALVYAISHLQPSDSFTIKSAFTRALRALATAIAEAVGPSQWGLRVETTVVWSEAKATLDKLFQVDYLDAYLPFLLDASSQTSTSISLLLASAVRNSVHRKAVTDWLPPVERAREVKASRGWEKPEMTNHAGVWVAKSLMGLLHRRDVKLQEAVLSALASLAKDNPTIANTLARKGNDSISHLDTIFSLTKSRSADVQLAACLCATHVLRACPPHHALHAEDSLVITILNSLNRILETGSQAAKTKACYVLFNVVKDDSTNCDLAADRHSLERLADALKSATPLPPVDFEEESESVCALREAALTTISMLCIFSPSIRSSVIDAYDLVPIIQASLSHRHIGVRYAACQCARTLSRGVSVLRTTMVDSGMGMKVFSMFLDEQEDRRVTFATLLCVCNLVNDFSPLRPVLMAQGLMQRLGQLMGSGDVTLRMNSLWSVKNLLNRASLESKKEVMNQLGWSTVLDLLTDADVDTQEQAFTVLQNLADNEEGVDLVMNEIGSDVLLARIVNGLQSPSSAVLQHATCLLANLANGSLAQQNVVLSYPRILQLLRGCLESKPEVRKPAVMCVLQIARTNAGKRKEIIETGILTTLKALSAGGTGHEMFVGIGIGVRVQHGVLDDDRDVVEEARLAIDWLEHGDNW